jgi:hypothetical protein
MMVEAALRGALVGISGTGDIAPSLLNEEQTEAWITGLHEKLRHFKGEWFSEKLLEDVRACAWEEAAKFVRGAKPDVKVRQAVDDPEVVWVSIVLVQEGE